MSETVVAPFKKVNRYVVKQSIGSGTFGDVFIAYSTRTGNEVAVKFCRENRQSMLEREYALYSKLRSFSGFPRMRWTGALSPTVSAVVMDLLGGSLEAIRKDFKTLTLRSVVYIMLQLIARMEDLHSTGYVHRDLKPGNLMVGRKDPGNIYVIDLGLAKRYQSRDGVHVEHGPASFAGTAKYSSFRALSMERQSRRDDMEALGYCAIKLYRGLSWDRVKKGRDGKTPYKVYARYKRNITRMCEGLPIEFLHYFKYVRALEFKAKPNYRYMARLMQSIVQRNRWNGPRFEWVEPKTRRDYSPRM